MKSIYRLLALLCILLQATFPSLARASVIDFESVAQFGSATAEFSTGGLNFATNFYHGVTDFTGYGYGNGTQYLYIGAYPQATETITAANGPAFSVNSLDIANFINLENGTLTLTGKKSGGGIVTTRLNIGLQPFLTYELAGFDNLISLQITGLGDGYAAIDSINISAVPLPAAWVLMPAGIGLLGFIGRRRKQPV